MTTPALSAPALATAATVGHLAAHLPGAAALFRAEGIGFCCHPGRTLAEAAALREADAGALLDRLTGLRDDATRSAPSETAALIDHILGRYHATHRRDLARLIPLARKVEDVHADDDAAPSGLANLLSAMRDDMEDHMAREEQMLFPMMRAGGHPMIVHPIAVMRAEHDGHGEQLRALEHLMRGFAVPEDACGSWRALIAGVERFAEDLVTHMHLENDVLFPRFGG